MPPQKKRFFPQHVPFHPRTHAGFLHPQSPPWAIPPFPGRATVPTSENAYKIAVWFRDIQRTPHTGPDTPDRMRRHQLGLALPRRACLTRTPYPPQGETSFPGQAGVSSSAFRSFSAKCSSIVVNLHRQTDSVTAHAPKSGEVPLHCGVPF